MREEKEYPLEEKIYGKPVVLHVDCCGRATFQVTLEEGNTLKHQILENLRENVGKHYDRQKTKKRKKLNIPFLLWTNEPGYFVGTGKKRGYSGFPRRNQEERPHSFVPCLVTSMHAGNGNPIIKIGNCKAKQDSWIDGTMFKPMSEEQKEEWAALYEAAETARKAVEQFKEIHALSSSSGLKCWLVEEHEVED
jgi:hypothetical protein